MGDLHARLQVRCDPSWYGMDDNPPAAFAALRAAVELHAPTPCSFGGCRSPGHLICQQCGAASTFPCDEVRVIAEKLGVEVNDQELIEKEHVDG